MSIKWLFPEKQWIPTHKVRTVYSEKVSEKRHLNGALYYKYFEVAL